MKLKLSTVTIPNSETFKLSLIVKSMNVLDEQNKNHLVVHDIHNEINNKSNEMN